MSHRKIIGLLLLFFSFAYAQDWAKIHPTGVRPLTPEEEARIRPKMFHITQPQRIFKTPLPLSVKNTTYLPVVTSQGQLGSCAAYATCYYLKTHQEAKENGWIRPDPLAHPERIASPAWGYNLATRVPAYGDAVSHFEVADIICEYGIASWQDMPYDGNPSTYQWDAWPSESVWRRAINWRGLQAGTIYIHSSEGIEALKEYLASGNLAVITTPVYSNFDAYPDGEYTDNEVLYANTTTGFRGGHALTVVGYDDNKQYFDAIEGKTKRGAFLCVNSWGTNWGVYEETMGSRGFIWLPYDFFLQKKNGDPDALVIIDRINYKPEITATIGINHTKGRKLIIKILGAEKNYPNYPPDSVRWIKEALPSSNDYPLENSRVVIDLTDFKHYQNFSWYLEVMQLQMYQGTGEINYFAVQNGDNEPIESPDVPKSPQTNWYIWCKASVFSDAGDIFGSLKVRRGGIAWADFNKDGKIDLLITGYDWKTGSAIPKTLLFFNNGNGSFQTGITGNLPQLGNSIIAACDYDNDTWIDVAIYGYDPSTQSTITRIYHNNGNNTFSPVSIVLPQEEVNGLSWVDFDNDGKFDLAISTSENLLLYKNSGGNNFNLFKTLEVSGNISWADYDNDGWIDFIVAGEHKTAIFKNNGDGIFTEANNNFPALKQASIAWGDYDNDGDLDFAISGKLSDSTAFTGIYRNNGDGSFTKIEASIIPVFAGDMVWADINNDGYPDLVITGRTEDEFSSRYLGNYPNRSTVYLNDTLGGFFNGIAELPGVSVADFFCVPDYNNTVAAIDYDNDGDLDIFLSGTNTFMYPTNPSGIYTGIQKNLFANKWLNQPNNPPQPPDSLSTEPGWENGSIVLKWNKGTDNETPSDGLYYNVRVGSFSGGSNIVNPVNRSIMPGFNPIKGQKLLLRQLPPGTYYWSVQTIDAGLSYSNWSTENTFVIGSHTQTYNLYINADSYGTTNPSPGVHAYNSGTNAQITAIPYGGFVFSHWSGDVENLNQNPLILTMDRPRTITAHFTIAYDISPQWTSVSNSIPGSSTIYHSTVIFNNKIWLLGGYQGSYRSNSIWYSSDGTNWTQVSTSNCWSPRIGHVSFVFNNKIWVIGGYDATGYLNDVWYSSDGITWTQATTNAPWQKRYNFAGLVFDGKMWIFGGKGANGWLNDVWYSTNGTNWTQATSSAMWQVREGHAAVVFDNKMWIIGGYQGPMNNSASDVWYSTNGSTWTPATQSAVWSPRYMHSAVVFDNRIWMIGGIIKDGSGWINPTNEVWYSYDGIYWSLFNNASWQPRYGHTGFVFNNKIWIFGGSYSDIWSASIPSIPSGTLRLTIGVNNGDAGTTIPSPGYYYDASGKVFHLKAVANYGYKFDNWSGDVANPDSPETTVTLNSSKTVVANFSKLPTYTLTLSINPSNSGTISPSPGSYSYPEGTVINLIATPSFNYTFLNWTGGVQNPDSPTTTVVMNSNKTITANFIPDPFAPSTHIAGGLAHTVFLQNEGTVWTWGLNSSGQLGNGNNENSSVPVPYAVLESVKAVSAGMYHTAALKTNGTVWAWGNNDKGQLGNGSSVPYSASPVQVSNLSQIVEISCGGNHNLALKNDGSVWAWGKNDSYQLGLGHFYGTSYLLEPKQVVGSEEIGYLTDVIRVSAGYDFSLALRKDGSVWAWGGNSWGQLGTGNTTDSFYPLKINGLSDIKGISAGGSGIFGIHAMAVKSDGSVWCWGANNKGQLGDGTNTDRYLPVQVKGENGTGFLSNIRKIAAGGTHSLALDKDGNVWAWGDNTYGQLGNGTNNDSVYPVKAMGLSEIKMIAAGQKHSMAIDKDGNVWIWGQNISGQIGNNSQINSNIPVKIEGIGLNNISFTLTVSVKPQLSGTTTPSGTRKYRNNAQATITAIPGPRYQFNHWSGDASGTETQITIIMDSNKNVVANFVLIPGLKCKLNMVCNPPGAGYLIPEEGEHEFDAGTAVNILVIPGYRYNFDRWSENVANPSAKETYVLLNGDTTVTAYFTKQDFSAFPDISAGGQHNLVLKHDGSVWTSGSNYYGQLGINSTVTDSPNVQVKDTTGNGYLSGIIMVSAGGFHSCALSYDGTVYTWGANSAGQLGDGTTSRRNIPVKVKSSDGTGELKGITYISAGCTHTAAVKMDGSLWMWGNNNYGQLGNNSTTNSNLPVQVHGEMDRGFLTKVKKVACGPEHTLALLEDGTVWAWGRNHYGQLGNGTTQDSFVPVKVLNLTDIVDIDASDYAAGPPFSIALKRDGTVWTWGGGDRGQLGNGQSGEGYYSSVPVKVSSLTNVIKIAAGDFHALALKNDGSVWAWGSNSMGQCGDNTYDNIRTTPVQVKGQDGNDYLTGIIDISAGYSYSMALKNDGTVWFWGINQYWLFGGHPWSLLRYPSPVQRPYTQFDLSAQIVYLRMNVYPSGAGKTSPIESIHAYNLGSIVNIRAMPENGYVFSHWNEGENVFLPDTTVTMNQSKTITAYFEKILPQIGDINKDGSIDIQDVILALRMTIELPLNIGAQTKNYPYSQDYLAIADVNSDGEVNIADAILILRIALGLTTQLPDPYAPRTVVGPETTPESKTVNVSSGQQAVVSLSDETKIILPPVNTNASVTLGRITNYIDIEKELGLNPEEGLSPQTSGSLRTLQIVFGSALTDEEKIQMIPEITIPRKEIGILNPDTVNILRVSEKIVDGKIVKNYSLLPVHFDNNGNLVTKDIYLAGELLEEQTPPGGTKAGSPPKYISYIPLTFQRTINWVRESKFVRMVPDAKSEAKRKPLDSLSDEEKKWELKKPIKNVIVLVHGHNEAEKTGLPGQFERNAPFPWAVDYKRDVWTYLYETFLKDYQEFNSCTVFYEFIYPTWRPIFGHLDDMLVEKITSELEKQLSYNIEEKDSFPFNLFIVAHSMGGVVSRAAIIKFPEVVDDQFKHFVSWGSPHRGAAMYSLRYLLTSPAYEAKTWTGSALSTAMGAYVGNNIIDAPGIMDLRWTNGSPGTRRFLQFDKYFEVKSEYQSQIATYDLRNGSLLYNQRLQQLNENDDRGAKYTFIYGITSKGIPADEIDDMGLADLVSVLSSGEIAIGATINRFLIENGFNILYNRMESDSDGAVPIVSMTGLGLNPSYLIDVGDIDHEEYYGVKDNARFVAHRTLEAFGFNTNPLYDPPEIIFTNPVEDELLETDEYGNITIEGKLDWKAPRKFGGNTVKDVKLYKYTYAYEMTHSFNWEGEEIPVEKGNWAIDESGNFSITANIANPEMIYALKVVIVFRDDTEMQGVCMLGCPDEFSTKAQGETITWRLDGLGKIFQIDSETYVYEKPKQGQTPAVNIYAHIYPVLKQDNADYLLFIGKYGPAGGDPLEYTQTEVIWVKGVEQPAELEHMEASLSTSYDDENLFVIAYDAIDYGDDSSGLSFLKRVFAFLFPWQFHEKEELLPPYFRKQILPEDGD
ncbi:MAG: FG-GAP-like repeat-containing protein [Candidatus Omnitrophica bacterium]|nr:FG-GAP-like repeat-containing protein [Candidatus Omnitrophota bacterium]